jgi:D-alanyl-D-alanine carboxypeptidase/D-alanyl-D-alanine-endopeptidase (penicillin-binding protein 4)
MLFGLTCSARQPGQRLRQAAWLLAAACAGLAANGVVAAQPAKQLLADSRLPAAVAEALQRAQLPAEALAAVVLPVGQIAANGPMALLARGAQNASNARHAGIGPGWSWQADRLMQPASTVKLLTTIVALDRLGPNMRGFTELLSVAPQHGDVLAGDLVLRGGADPELGLPQLWALLAELRWQGIREIAGDIVLDRTLFRPAGRAGSAAPFDAWPEMAYNQAPDALQLNGNLLGLEISSENPAAPGQVLARALPPLPGVEIDASALRLTDRSCRDWAEDWISPPLRDEPAPGRLRITLRGGFPKACTQRTGLALIDSTALAERHLRWVWQGLGGEWRGQLREASTPLIGPVSAPVSAPASAPALRLGLAQPTPPQPTPLSPPPSTPLPSTGAPPGWVAPGVAWAGTPGATPPGLRLLARRLARPWGEVLRLMNKQSDNPDARLLFLSLGLAAMADDAITPTRELAGRAVQSWLAEHQIPSAGLVLDNGSGLSRSERISPRQLALMLQTAHAGAWAPELLMSLPVAGVDGSMRNRLKTSPVAGWARLKTGSIKGVVALAGYVPDAQGRWWALAAMINHEQAASGRLALDALVDWVARGGMTVP